MATVNPYIIFEGRCEEAFNHYRKVFGGEFSMLSRYSDMPPQDGVEIPASYSNRIMHIELPISEETVLMGSDSGGGQAPETVAGNNIFLSLAAESKMQADAWFNQLSEEGKVSMPMDNTFWGSYFGMCTDKYDIHWMVSFGEAPTE
jgi:PhnB protein